MKIFIKPAPGLTVRDPDTLQPLPRDGAEVDRTTHWLRRLAAGDVVEVPPAKTRPAKEG